MRKLYSLPILGVFGVMGMSMVLGSCVESRAVSNKTSSLKTVAKAENSDSVMNRISGQWLQACSDQDEQEVAWIFQDKRFVKEVRLYLEKGCPSGSIAAVFRSQGNFEPLESVSQDNSVLRVAYLQDSYTLSIRHRSYLNAYNGLHEYAGVEPFCKGYKFRQNVETSLIGLRCQESSDSYELIQAEERHDISLKLEASTLLEGISIPNSPSKANFRKRAAYKRLETSSNPQLEIR